MLLRSLDKLTANRSLSPRCNENFDHTVRQSSQNIPTPLKKPAFPFLPHAEYIAVTASHTLNHEVVSNVGDRTILNTCITHSP